MYKRWRIAAKFLSVSMCGVVLWLYVMAIAAPCQTVQEIWCNMSTGQRCNCPGGELGNWIKIGEYDVLRTLCSGYTPGCGDGPCNRLIQHKMTFAHWGCFLDGELCKTKHCVQSYNGNEVMDFSCTLHNCTGPVVSYPVLPQNP